MIRSGRRRFLVGLGGLMVALPFLEGLERPTRAEGPDRRFFLFFRQWYGVQQKPRFGGVYKDEAEGFWPDAAVAPGGSVALSKKLLEQSNGGDIRATGELADFADSLLMMRGVRLMDLSVVLHRQNLVQVMTGSRFEPTRPGYDVADPNNAWPIHETLDNRIGRAIDGKKPVVFETVISGSQTSFDNGKDGAIPNENPTLQQPSAAYAQLFDDSQTDARTAALRLSASDAVASELKSLRADPRLSAEDRRRLDAHFDAMNNVETMLKCLPPDVHDASMAAVLDSDLPKTSDPSKPRWQALGNFNEHVETVTDAFIQIAALGVACGAFRAGNIVMPPATNFDHSTIFEPGTIDYDQGFEGHYHPISHRSFSDDSDNTGGELATRAHHRIDRWHARKFAKLLGLLRDAGVLDQGITLWSNEISFGDHWAYDMPYIAAGSAGGKLKTGQLVDLQSVAVEAGDVVDEAAVRAAIMSKQMPCSKVLNTIGAALGITGDDGSKLADFGGYQRDLPRITGNLSTLLT